MARWPGIFALLLAALIALAPAAADARAGGSYSRSGGSSFFSQGSRGSQTYSNSGAQPLQRSITPQAPSGSPYAAQPGYGYGFGTRHPFLTGLAGGFFGSWLGSLLFPHWGMGYGWGFGGVIGSVFSWLFIIGLIWFAFRLLTGRRFGPLTSPDAGQMGYSGPGPSRFGLGGGAPRQAALAITQSDYQSFEAILKHVQGAWSKGDLAELRHYVTPEMLSYFSEELAENESQGVVNRVEDVQLLRGDLREAWDEGRLQYATCYLQWRARDYTVSTDTQTGDPAVAVGGDPQRATEAAEVWTFVRSPGGHWLLSAIQQV